MVTCPEALAVVMRTSSRTYHTPEQICIIVFRLARFPNCFGLIQGGTPCVNIN